jgi:thiamine kinase-like enzyme
MNPRTLKSVYNKINKQELKSEKIELNKIEDLLSSLRRSGEYDAFDELAQLNKFAQRIENGIRKKQQKLDEVEKEASRLRQSVKELGLDRELKVLNDIDNDIKVNRSNINKVLKIVQQAQMNV